MSDSRALSFPEHDMPSDSTNSGFRRARQGRTWVLGLDVGGTKIAAGLVEFPVGRIHIKRVIATKPVRGGAAILRDAERLTSEILRTNQHERKVAAVGIGICELVDLDGNLASAATLDWKRTMLEARFKRLGPVVLEADVRAAALAEAEFGAGKGLDNWLYVTIGTGISSCLVLRGAPYAGARGLAGTMASSPLGSICSACGHEELRSLEDFASGRGIVSRYATQSRKIVRSTEQVLAWAEAGDQAAQSIVRTASVRLGRAIGDLINVLDPGRVVIGGGLGCSGGEYWKIVVRSARDQIWSKLNRQIDIVPAQLGPDAGLIGAATRAWHARFSPAH